MAAKIEDQKKLFDLLSIARNRYSDVVIWVAYNIIIGTMSLWIMNLTFLFGNPKIDYLANVKNGTLLIFIATLIGTSMGFFAEVTKKHFWNPRRFLFWGLLLLLIFSIFSYPIISMPSLKEIFNIKETLVVIYSGVLFLLAAVLCAFLYLMRLSFEEDAAFSLPEEQKKEVEHLTKEARENKSVDGIKI